jgi:hypothetical protein
LIPLASKTIKEIVHAELVSPLVSILNHNQGALVTPVNIKAISRLETGTEIQIGCVFTDGSMPLLAKFGLTYSVCYNHHYFLTLTSLVILFICQ